MIETQQPQAMTDQLNGHMDKAGTLQQMKTVNWLYVNHDGHALDLLEKRIADTGRKLGLITYSQLVKGVAFRLPNIRRGEAYSIQTFDWSGLDRAIIGEFLGYISMRSLE